MTNSALPEITDVRENILATGQRIMAGKGFSAVGLNEILLTAGVPKGSFYHYFSSKDAFGEAMLRSYFDSYWAELEQTLSQPNQNMAQRLMSYWNAWQHTQSFYECQGKCLAVKLGAEVADLSEAMRLELKRGTAGIIERLARAITAGVEEGSLAVDETPECAAQSLYQLWMGASLMVKIVRTLQPFDTAMLTTRKILHVSE